MGRMGTQATTAVERIIVEPFFLTSTIMLFPKGAEYPPSQAIFLIPETIVTSSAGKFFTTLQGAIILLSLSVTLNSQSPAFVLSTPWRKNWALVVSNVLIETKPFGRLR